MAVGCGSSNALRIHLLALSGVSHRSRPGGLAASSRRPRHPTMSRVEGGNERVRPERTRERARARWRFRDVLEATGLFLTGAVLSPQTSRRPRRSAARGPPGLWRCLCRGFALPGVGRAEALGPRRHPTVAGEVGAGSPRGEGRRGVPVRAVCFVPKPPGLSVLGTVSRGQSLLVPSGQGSRLPLPAWGQGGGTEAPSWAPVPATWQNPAPSSRGCREGVLPPTPLSLSRLEDAGQTAPKASVVTPQQATVLPLPPALSRCTPPREQPPCGRG